MIRLRVYCFGAFVAVLDGEELTGFRSDKARALFAYLLLSSGQPIPRTVLQELFWEGYDAKSARANLRSTLSNLAKLLKPHASHLLHITRKTVQFVKAEQVWCDVWAFEALIEQKGLDPEHSEEALPTSALARKLVKGDFLAGLCLPDSPAYEQWRKEQAHTYRKQLLALFPHNLPRQGTTFIGRFDEVDAIMVKVLAPDYPLITLMGTGGVGKSRLALRVGQQARGHFNDGVWWVPLAGLEKAEFQADLPEQLAMTIGQALNLTFKPNQPPTEQLFEHVRSFEALLLLDNLEHLLPARLDKESAVVDFILDLLRHTEHLKILVTSRQRLNVPEEFLFNIEGLPLPRRLEGADKSPALTLFAERANRFHTRFALSGSNLPAVSRICQELAGLPLGIELAASLVAAQSAEQIALSMIEGQNRLALAANWRSLPPRQRSLWALFEHSWQLLTPRQQEIFAQLAVFRDGVTFQATSSVIDASQPDLEALLAKSLLRLNEERFDMHPLVHDFAAQKLAKMGALEVTERHASYYLALLAQQEQKIETATNKEPLLSAQRELANIRAAWRWAVHHRQVELLGQSPSGFRLLAERLGLIKEGLAAMQSAIKSVRKIGEVSEALPLLLLQQAILLRQTTKLDLALISLQEATQLATSPQTLGQVIYYWALICASQANYAAAQEKTLQALTFFRQANDQRGEKKVSYQLGNLAIKLEDYSTAEQYFWQVYNLIPNKKDAKFKGMIMVNLAVVQRMQGHYNKALLYGDAALTLFHEIGDIFAEGLAMTNHALLALHLGNYEQASSLFEQAINLWQEGNFEHLKDGLYVCCSLLHHHLGNHKKALMMAKQAKELSQTKANLHHLGLAYLLLGHAKRPLAVDLAASAYQESFNLLQENHKQKASQEALGGLAAVAFEQKRLDEALTVVEQIMTHRKENPTLVGTLEPIRILLTCIKVLEAAGQTERADSLLEETAQLLMQRANNLEDEQLRESFLQNVSFHREIVARESKARILRAVTTQSSDR